MQAENIQRGGWNSSAWRGRLRSAISGEILLQATKHLAGNLHVHGFEHALECKRLGRPVIFTGWHGHNLVSMAAYRKIIGKHFKCAIMVPEIADGMVIDHLGRRLGLDVVRVQPELGPAQWARATTAMIKLIRRGYCVMLSPDGPFGPAHKAKPGIVLMGQRSGAAIIPTSAASSSAVRLGYRWDDHLVPLPWGKTVVHFSQPVEIDLPDDQSPEALQNRIEDALRENTRKAEAICKNPEQGGL